MSDITVKPLGRGAECCFIKNERFKTARISVSFYLPRTAETLSETAILPFLLTGSCEGFPDSRSLCARTDTLFGANLFGECDKSADNQVVRVGIGFIENAFVPDGSDLFSDCADLLCRVIFRPAVSGDGFIPANFEKEKRMLIERIEGEINDKRGFARARCEAELCKGEPYGLPRLGTVESARALTPEGVLGAWRRMLETAYIRVCVSAAEPHDEFFERFAELLSKFDRSSTHVPECVPGTVSDGVAEIGDAMDVTQGKLVLGFRLPAAGGDRETAAEMVFADLYGGGPYSRLFSNVREKMSLCYYCAARANRRKGIMLVDSGVEFENMEKARGEILNQLEVMRDGGFTDAELQSSKRALCDTLRGGRDSQGFIDRWYAERVFDAEPLSPDGLAELVEGVTRGQITEIAQKVKLNAVYRLTGKGGSADE